MKKIFLSLSLVCAVALSTMAQVKRSANPGGLILKGGVNLANVSNSSNGAVDEANTLTSFHAGVVADLSLSEGLSLQPGLLVTGKGTKSSVGSSNDRNFWEATSNPIYLELPVNVVGKIPLGNKSLFVGAGPYAAMGIAGKNKTEGKILGVGFSRDSDINFSDDDPTTSYEENAGFGKLKRFDYGVNVLGGLDLGKVIIGANYGHGFAKINSGASDRANDRNKNRVLSFSLGLKL